MSNDLLFWRKPGSADLVFNDSPAPLIPHYDVDMSGALPALSGHIVLGEIASVTVAGALPVLMGSVCVIPNNYATAAGALPALTGSAVVTYASNTQRPTVGQIAAPHQDGIAAQVQTSALHQQSTPLFAQSNVRHQQAQRAPVACAIGYESAQRIAQHRTAPFQQATRAAAATDSSMQVALMVRGGRDSSYQTAQRVGAAQVSPFQVCDSTKRLEVVTAYQLAEPVRADHVGRSSKGYPVRPDRRSGWQEAIRPPAGIYIEPITPVTPGRAYSADLLFAQLATGGANLLFGATYNNKARVVVPVQAVYMIINDVTIKRVSNNLSLDALSVSLRVDVDSWTWGFTASFPVYHLDDLLPDANGDPVELDVSINGYACRVLVESVQRDRTFATGQITATGRGKAAYLDTPYAVEKAFSFDTDLTAQQLMAAVLTNNGVSLGWGVDWRISDWLVPAASWALQGSYIAACKAIAEAAGAFLQPHPTDTILRVRPRYPDVPWNWASLTPDYELPADVTTKESISWVEKPRYNAVFVTGVSKGVVGQVIRTGTAGDCVAPTVTDALITSAVAARQRGVSILSDTGRIATVTLKVPVLPTTGVIEPGAILDYVDGDQTRRGIVRSTDVDVSYPEVFQSLTVETHG